MDFKLLGITWIFKTRLNIFQEVCFKSVSEKLCSMYIQEDKLNYHNDSSWLEYLWICKPEVHLLNKKPYLYKVIHPVFDSDFFFFWEMFLLSNSMESIFNNVLSWDRERTTTHSIWLFYFCSSTYNQSPVLLETGS